MTDNSRHTGFAVSRLDRRAQLRQDRKALATAFETARCVLFAGDSPLLRLRDGETADILFSREEAEELRANTRTPILLGHDEAGAIFALPIGAHHEDDRLKTIDLRSIAVQGLVDPELMGALALAKSLIDWHARHGFCANCGHATSFAEAGYRRDCGQCGARHFPRTDPVAIMLVTHGDDCLLAHEPRFRENMVSTLAGFVEPGETIEDAVRREVLEEAGIPVGRVAYHASQPWPFPSSLMIGCIAEAMNREIEIDPTEIVWARWFARDEVRQMLKGEHPEGTFVPPPMAIAHQLMRHFVAG